MRQGMSRWFTLLGCYALCALGGCGSEAAPLPVGMESRPCYADYSSRRYQLLTTAAATPAGEEPFWWLTLPSAFAGDRAQLSAIRFDAEVALKDPRFQVADQEGVPVAEWSVMLIDEELTQPHYLGWVGPRDTSTPRIPLGGRWIVTPAHQRVGAAQRDRLVPLSLTYRCPGDG